MGLMRFLRPMRILRRKAVLSGVFGGSRFWLIAGGAAWLAHWAGRILGTSDPLPVYSEELGVGERIVVAHLPLSPGAEAKAARRARRASRRS
jgi:hypothetical protein